MNEVFTENTPEQERALDEMPPATRLFHELFKCGLKLRQMAWAVPATLPVPSIICKPCAGLWAAGVRQAALAGVHQRRAAACPCGDPNGLTLAVAFLTMHADGSAPQWLCFTGIRAADRNEKYFSLMIHRGGVNQDCYGPTPAEISARDAKRAAMRDRLAAEAVERGQAFAKWREART